jgi:lipoprotein NlpD
VCGLLAVLTGCASALTWEPDAYTVQTGDTLYKIAFRHSLDHRDLAAWNGLGDGSLIFPGQKLRLAPPSGSAAGTAGRATSTGSAPRSSGSSGSAGRSAGRGAAAAPASSRSPGRSSSAGSATPPDWRWPTTGRVISAFGRNPKNPNGMQIGGRIGQAVKAASAGEVVYSGSGLIGYGQLIIVKHDEAFLSAYGHNQELMVREGQRVAAGQTIAAMGEGPGKKPILHFEIRRDGKPVDPILFLPAR